jgi:hypothetical protein
MASIRRDLSWSMFLCRDRCCAHVSSRSPDLVHQRPCWSLRRLTAGAGIEVHWDSMTRTCTRLSVVFTCCPPGPPAREKDQVSAEAGK